MDPLRGLAEHGQSVWIADLCRSQIWTGFLHRQVEDGLAGVTSDPSTLERAIGDSSDYLPAIEAGVRDGLDAGAIFEQLTADDARWACDLLRPVYDRTDGRDGFCTVVVSPHVAREGGAALIDAALQLHERIDRDNLMVTFAAFPSSLSVVPDLVASGISVCLTHIFSAERYVEAQDGFVRGLEELSRAGGDLTQVRGVVSFSVGAIDRVAEDLSSATAPKDAAIALAKHTYAAFRAANDSDRWRRLASQGARPLCLGWTDLRLEHWEALVGPETIAIVDPETLHGFGSQEKVAATLNTDLQTAQKRVAELEQLGLTGAFITEALEERSLRASIDAYDRIMARLQDARVFIMGSAQPSLSLQLGEHQPEFERVLRTLEESDSGPRRRSDGGADGLDFEDVDAYASHLEALHESIQAEKVESVVLLASGATGLASRVFAEVFGQVDGSPELWVLDSTSPEQIALLEDEVALQESLFVVALPQRAGPEPEALEVYFRERVKDGDRFVAITSREAELADRDFRWLFHADPAIDERFAALSLFGLAPLAAVGFDIAELTDTAQLMVASCSPSVPASANPGVRLGAALNALAGVGRNKLTVVASAGLRPLSRWIEQLVGGATGKAGRGVVVVCDESLGPPEAYGDDRIFMRLVLEDDEEDAADLRRLEALHRAGHPLIDVVLSDARDISQEMVRWAVASVTVAQLLGVDPHARPEGDAGDALCAELISTRAQAGQRGELPDIIRIAEDGELAIFTDRANAEFLATATTFAEVVGVHLDRLQPGDYAALNAFIVSSDEHERVLRRIRLAIRDRYRVATTVGFGPHFVSATGQLQKGGPGQGLFIQLTCDDDDDIAIPGRPYTFADLKAAQQDADFVALSARGRRQVRIHLGGDPLTGLERLAALLKSR